MERPGRAEFEAVQERARFLRDVDNDFKDPYGRDWFDYQRALAADPVYQSLRAAFSLAREEGRET
jgi:hypothetical protein